MDGVPILSKLNKFQKPKAPPGECARCQFSVHQGPDMVCVKHPPQVTILLVPSALNAPGRQGFMPQAYTAFPIMKPDQGCWEFEVENGSAVRADQPATSSAST
jgi:hypothetical protein